MIIEEENLDFEYWSDHLPEDFQLTPWERKKVREYFLTELRMSTEHELDYDSRKLKLMVDFYRWMSYLLSGS